MKKAVSVDSRIQQYSILETQTLLGYKSRRSIYNLIEEGYLEKINPRPHVARITGSSLMDYLETTNAGRQPVAKYTPKAADPRAAAPRQEAQSSRAKSVLEWMGIKR